MIARRATARGAAQMLRPMFWGLTAPCDLLLSAALDVWLMSAPAVFGMRGRAADSGAFEFR